MPEGNRNPSSPDLEAIEVETLRRMTPERKLQVMRSLVRQAYSLKAAGLRLQRPELSEDEIWAITLAQVGRDGP
jgi:hypothetical protein